MKKQVFIVVCALCVLCALVLPAFAEDSPIYVYSFTPTLPYSGPTVRATLPASFVCAKDSVSTLDNTVVFHTGDSVTTSGASFDSNAGTCKLSCTINGTSSLVTIAIGEPFYIYSNESTLTAKNGTDILTGTLYVDSSDTTSSPETTSAPPAFGGSVDNGVTTSVGFLGQVLDFIVDSPVLICIGISVGVFLCGFAISKIKDLIKGY